jgi:hypothetical protein
MGTRVTLAEAFRSAVAREFAFLVDDFGFAGPEQIEHGLLFRGTGYWIEVWHLGGLEPEVTTLVVQVAPDGGRACRAWLEDLYVASGLGPAQSVPGSAPTRLTVLKRVRQHATALRRLLPRLLTAEGTQLITSCHLL